jgi:hypothetical protein
MFIFWSPSGVLSVFQTDKNILIVLFYSVQYFIWYSKLFFFLEMRLHSACFLEITNYI